MSMQQDAQSNSYVNGFSRQRPERDGGTRVDSKLQSGKSNPNRPGNSVIGGKVGVHESPARDRLIYLSACLIGQTVEVHLENGTVLSGIFHTANIDKEYAISLEMARTEKDNSFRGQRTELSKAPTKFMIVPGKDVVQLIAKDVSITVDGIANEVQHEKRQEILIDAHISQTRHAEVERELAPWVPDEDDPQCPELENIFDGQWNNRGWDQFQTNAMLFGVTSTFDEELYTTKLEKGPQMRELEKQAMRIAREIEGEDTKDLHLAEERGIHLDESSDIDEETRFSSVYRGTTVDDSGYDEVEDIVLDSRNSETFGETSNGVRIMSTSYADETLCRSSDIADSDRSGSHEQPKQLASEISSKSLFTSDRESRILGTLYNEQEATESIKESFNEKYQVKDVQLQTCEDSRSSNAKTDGSDTRPLSPDTKAYAPSSNVSSANHEKTRSKSELSEAGQSVKREVQSVNSRGRPGSSTSSVSDCVGVPSVSNDRGLSPSSSVGSLSSEKSTLNPYAKEFKLNPNAKSFTPVRPPSPASDGSFYVPPNVPALLHLHGMPMGYGIGPSFAGHQPVMFNSQVPSMQTPQAYFHPGGPQVLLGHPRQVMYYPPQDMPYNGREF